MLSISFISLFVIEYRTYCFFLSLCLASGGAHTSYSASARLSRSRSSVILLYLCSFFILFFYFFLYVSGVLIVDCFILQCQNFTQADTPEFLFQTSSLMCSLSAFPSAAFPLYIYENYPQKSWCGETTRTWTHRTPPVITGKAGWVMRNLRFLQTCRWHMRSKLLIICARYMPTDWMIGSAWKTVVQGLEETQNIPAILITVRIFVYHLIKFLFVILTSNYWIQRKTMMNRSFFFFRCASFQNQLEWIGRMFEICILPTCSLVLFLNCMWFCYYRSACWNMFGKLQPHSLNKIVFSLSS